MHPLWITWLPNWHLIAPKYTPRWTLHVSILHHMTSHPNLHIGILFHPTGRKVQEHPVDPPVSIPSLTKQPTTTTTAMPPTKTVFWCPGPTTMPPPPPPPSTPPPPCSGLYGATGVHGPRSPAPRPRLADPKSTSPVTLHQVSTFFIHFYFY